MKQDSVATITVPHYEGLKLERVFEFLQNYPAVFEYYPPSAEIRKMPREWILNVASTVIGQPFRQWVHDTIKARN